jgi:hypothetical protein
MARRLRETAQPSKTTILPTKASLFERSQSVFPQLKDPLLVVLSITCPKWPTYA